MARSKKRQASITARNKRRIGRGGTESDNYKKSNKWKNKTDFGIVLDRFKQESAKNKLAQNSGGGGGNTIVNTGVDKKDIYDETVSNFPLMGGSGPKANKEKQEETKETADLDYKPLDDAPFTMIGKLTSSPFSQRKGLFKKKEGGTKVGNFFRKVDKGVQKIKDSNVGKVVLGLKDVVSDVKDLKLKSAIETGKETIEGLNKRDDIPLEQSGSDASYGIDGYVTNRKDLKQARKEYKIKHLSLEHEKLKGAYDMGQKVNEKRLFRIEDRLKTKEDKYVKKYGRNPYQPYNSPLEQSGRVKDTVKKKLQTVEAVNRGIVAIRKVVKKKNNASKQVKDIHNNFRKKLEGKK